MRKKVITISSIVFGVVSLLHLLRVIYALPVLIGEVSLGLWVSVLGFLATGALCLLNWKYRE